MTEQPEIDWGDTPTRRRLLNRRPLERETLSLDGHDYTVDAGIELHTGAVRELFLHAAKPGSTLDTLLDDIATVISVSLQFGVPIEALAKSVACRPATAPTRPEDLDRLGLPAVSRGQPASAVGAALDFLHRVEAEG